jgi:hypothetical protein
MIIDCGHPEPDEGIVTMEVDVPIEVYQQLANLSDRTGRTINELWMEALSVFLNTPSPEQVRAQLERMYDK